MAQLGDSGLALTSVPCASAWSGQAGPKRVGAHRGSCCPGLVCQAVQEADCVPWGRPAPFLSSLAALNSQLSLQWDFYVGNRLRGHACSQYRHCLFSVG